MPADEPLADDESLVDGKPTPTSVSIPLEYQHGKTLNEETESYSNKHEEIGQKGRKSKSKTKRGYGRKMKSKHKQGISNIKLNLLGTNANGLKNKMDSLKQTISELLPSIITPPGNESQKGGVS